MNNEQFRRLVLDNPTSKPKPTGSNLQETTTTKPSSSASSHNAALGSRMRSSIPMTPRAITTATTTDFARQLADYRREHQQPPTKKFKSSAAPKGTRLPSGYQDRAAARLNETYTTTSSGGDSGVDKIDSVEDHVKNNGNNNENLEQRVKALEEMVKLGQIDQGTFEKLRGELGVGGDIGSTHMVKGLDWDLLRRVRAGEDIQQPRERAAAAAIQGTQEGSKEDASTEAVDIDEELEKLEGLPVASTAKENKEVKKKGNMAPAKKTRDEILREWKASRAAAAAAAAAPSEPEPEPVLGIKFKRIGGGASSKVEKKRWVEQDEATGRRREVLLITDADGKTKRKVRWLDKPGAIAPPSGLLVPDKAAKPLGMEVPAEFAKANTSASIEEEDDDIFAGVGADYNPLAELGEGDDDDSSSESGEEDGEVDERNKVATTSLSVEAKGKRPSTTGEAEPARATKPRNYFTTSTSTTENEVDMSGDRSNPLTKDPVLLAALKRAATIRQAEGDASATGGNDDDEGVDRETLLRREKFLEEARRREALDAMDLDFGFGGSRIEDDEDEEAVILEDGRGGSKKRKRGPKKKKGDKDSAADVMSVLERRKQG